MKTITPKGKKAIIVAGGVLIVIIAAIVFPKLDTRFGNTPPEEFNEQAHTEIPEFSLKIPFENDHFRIYYDNYYSQMVIVPAVEIDHEKNPIEEFDRVWPTYEQYALEAIAWMKAEGADLAAYDISFWGEDFWPTGRRIVY